MSTATSLRLTSKGSMPMSRFTALLCVGVMLSLGLGAASSYSSGAEAATATATAAVVPAATPAPGSECLDDVTGESEPCDFGMEPVRFPSGRTIGEYETAVLTRSAANRASTVSMNDFTTGVLLGSCVPDVASCGLDNRVRVGDDGPLYTDATPVLPSSASTTVGDTAVAKADFNGDGREDVVTAALCPVLGSSTPSEICLRAYDPDTDTWSAWSPTGLVADSVKAVGRIKLATGRIAQTTAKVTGASFTTSADGSNLLMRLTTDIPHRLTTSDALRFDAAGVADLASALCLPTDDDGTEPLCAGDLAEGLWPIESIATDRLSFVVALGTLQDASAAATCPPEGFRCLADGTREPLDWSSDTGFGVTGTNQGLAVAWVAPSASVQLATFIVRLGTSAPFSLSDVHSVGVSTGARQPLDVVTGDFNGGAPDEIAVGFGSTCTGLACLRVRIFRWNDSKQLVPVGAVNAPADAPRISGNANLTVSSVSLASGRLTKAAGTNLDGDDLLVAVQSTSGTIGCPVLQACMARYAITYDIGGDFVPKAAATTPIETGSEGLVASRYSFVAAAADFDGDGMDDPVIGRTTTQLLGTTESRAAFTVIATLSSTGTRLTFNGDDDMRAVGVGGSGQLALAVGQTGSLEDSSTQGFPNAINPDIVLAWTCVDTASCGAAASGSSVAILPIAVKIQATPEFFPKGKDKLSPSDDGGIPSVLPAAPLPATYNAITSEATHVAVALPDLDADSQTLGTPVTYVTVGEVRPLMILRSPPVHFDAFPALITNDGKVSYTETRDTNGCFGAKTPSDCDVATVYSSSSTLTSSIAGSINNSWGIGASLGVNAWFGKTEEAKDSGNTKCKSGACGELDVLLETEYNGEQADTSKQGSNFTYSFSKTALAGSDEVLAFTAATETTEYPIYPGTSIFGGELEPGRYVRVESPVQSTLAWRSATDPEITSSGWQRSVPGNILSYPKSANTLPTDTKAVTEAVKIGPQTVRITTSGDHGYTCTLADFTTTDGTRQLAPPGYLSKFPCAADARLETVSLSGFGGEAAGLNGKSFKVTQIDSANELQLLSSSTLSDLDWKAGAKGCTTGCGNGTLKRLPGALDRTAQTVGSSTTNFSVEFSDTSEFEAAASWSLNTSLSASLKISAGLELLGGGGVSVKLKGNYQRSEAATRSVAMLAGTKFEATIPPVSETGTRYVVQPFLTSDPRTNAMTFDWTASCDIHCNTGVWNSYLYQPDLAFALPELLNPYKTPNNTGDNYVNMLRSPDFETWKCRDDATLKQKVCSAPPLALAGKTSTIATTVHNYSLKAYASSTKPITIRYYVGDPARGGYPVLDAPVPSSAGCGFAYCITPQGEVKVLSDWIPALGLSGRGTTAAPLPIYAVIRTTMPEVHPWSAPISLADCDATYPNLAGAIPEYREPGGTAKRPSLCPTTNNQAYFPIRFGGKPAQPTDLSVFSSGVVVSKDGRSASIKVKSSSAITGKRAIIRIWACPTTSTCLPQTLPIPKNASAATGWGKTVSLTIGKGGTQTITMPLNTSGAKKITVQVIPLDVWERPGGPALNQPGQLGNNQVTKVVTIG